ncbi:MAG TPA: hypothetical protein VIV60_25025 [Polyangiaceae bacterium]
MSATVLPSGGKGSPSVPVSVHAGEIPHENQSRAHATHKMNQGAANGTLTAIIALAEVD